MVATFFDKCYTYCQVMNMKITVLTENTSHCGLPAEHGISFYIETGAHKLLFDTGQSALFAANAAAVGKRLQITAGRRIGAADERQKYAEEKESADNAFCHHYHP